MLQGGSGRTCVRCIFNSLYTSDLSQAKDPSGFPTQELSPGEAMWRRRPKIQGLDVDSPTRAMTWARSFNFLRLLSFPDIQWAYNRGYLRSKSCHEAQTQESETLPGFRWSESLSYSVQTFIRCYDTATSSYRVDEFWGLLHPVLIFRV